jgi:hypothetical protein
MLRSVATRTPAFHAPVPVFVGDEYVVEILMRLAFGLFLGSVTLTPLFLTVQEQREHLRAVVRDRSSHIFSHLTAEEINRRTLKAAAAMDRSHRRYWGAAAATGPSAELKVRLTKQLMETNARQIALFKNQHGALPATLDEVASNTPETVMFP